MLKRKIKILLMIIAFSIFGMIVLKYNYFQNSEIKSNEIINNKLKSTTVISNRQEVDFIDKNLKEGILKKLRITIQKPESESIIYLDELSRITSLTIQNAGIENIEGIENLSNLTVLNLSENKIKNIDPLKNLTKLKTLRLVQNNISDIEPISNLINLVELTIQNNGEIKSIEPLRNLKKLEVLLMGGNKLKDISVIGTLINLKNLGLSNNEIENIEPLSNLTNLNRLLLINNKIKNIDPLRRFPKKVHISLERNNILDLSGLPNVDYNLIHTQIIEINHENNIFNLEPKLLDGTILNIEDPGLIKNNDGTYSLVNPELELNLKLKEVNTFKVFHIKINPIIKMIYNKEIPIIGGKKENIPNEIDVIIENDKGLPQKIVKGILNNDKTAYLVNENLEKKDKNNNIINYNVKLVDNISNYLINNIDKSYEYISPKSNLVISKNWQGGDDIKPNNISIKVKRKIVSENIYKDVKTIELLLQNNWELVVTDLDLTNMNGELYEYIVEEQNVPNNFTVTYNGLNITNTYIPPKKQEEIFVPIVNGKKENIPNEIDIIVRNDKGLPEKIIKGILTQDKTGYMASEEVNSTTNSGSLIEYSFDPITLIDNYVIENNIYIYKPKEIDLSKTVNFIGGSSLWEELSVNLYANDEELENNIQITKEELLNNNGRYVYINKLFETDENGEIINYELRTDKQLNNFTREFRDGNIYFIYQNETKTIPYTVEFIGGNPNNRPEVTVNLKNQNDTIDTKTTTGNTVFENVIAKNPDGTDINYTIEVSVNHPNYIVRDNKVIYVSPKIDFTATKQWENGKIRQDVTLNLFRDGVNQNMPKTVREGTVTWTDLDKTDNFENIYTYTMEEETTLENYRKEYNNDKTEVKNVYVIPKTTLENKVIFPNDKLKDVKISILKDGQKQENTQKTVNTTTLVNYSDLDKTDINGNDITYTLTVDNVLPDGYTWKLDQDKNIIIEYTSPKIALTVTKAWINGDNLIPDDIEVSLKRRKQGTNDNFVEVQKINVEKSNNWTKEITNLDKTDENANIYEYVVEEITKIENFTNRVENFKITNIYNIPTKEYDITVNVDGGDKTKIPNTIEVDIIGKDGVVKTTTLTLNEDKTAYVNKVVLDKTDNKGDLIDYKVDVKTNVENYNKDNTGSNATTTITYVSPKVDVTRKIHIDPKLIEKLKESGKTTIDLNLSKDNQNIGETKSINLDDFINGKTTITFNDLDKTDFNGKDYIYDVNTINLPDKYLEIKEGNIIRIEKEIEHFDKKITLEYNGGKVRSTVEVEILKDNKVIKTVKLTNSELILKDLESNDKTGHEFSYTTRIKNEDKIVSNNYEIKLEDTKENTKITLNYIIPKTDETFKILYPGSNGENPQVKVQILRDGIPTGEVITLNGEKEYTFKNLDKTDFNGNEYNYTISVIGTINGYETQVSISGKVLVVTKNIENGKILPYAGVENNLSTIAIVLVLIITSTYSNIMIKQSNNMNISGRIRRRNRK